MADVNFINERLFDCDGWSSTTTIYFNTTIVERKNKEEARNQEWEYPLRRFSVAYDLLDKSQQEMVYGAFLVAKGRRHTFRYKDWTNYQCAGSIQATTGTNTYQLSNNYVFGSASAIDPIYLPVQSTVVVKDPLGNILTEGIGYSIDYLTGIITLISVASAGTYQYQCEYDRKVRFDSDEVQVNSIAYIDGSIGTASTIELTEVRNDDEN